MTLEEWEAFVARSPALARRFARLHPKRVPKPPPPRARVFDPTPPRALKRWTLDEERTLRSRWGEVSLNIIARELGRSPDAIRARAEALDLGPPTRGMSLRYFAKWSGFSETKILNAAAAAGIRIPYAKAGRLRRRKGTHYRPQRSTRYDIGPELGEELLTELLKPGFVDRSRAWGEGGRAAACRDCGTTSRPHKAHDRCRRCYQRARQAARSSAE